jgi:hypothetical protein
MCDSKGFERNLHFGLEPTILNLKVSFALAASKHQGGDSLRSDSQFFDALEAYLKCALCPAPHCPVFFSTYIYLNSLCFSRTVEEEIC